MWKAAYFRQIFLSVFGELYHKEKLFIFMVIAV